MKIRNGTFKLGLAVVAAALTTLVANAADQNVSEGFAYPFSCGTKAGVNIENIPALEGQGIGGGDIFVTASTSTPVGLGFDGAGFVWIANPEPFPGQDLVRMEILFEGDPKAAQIRICYNSKEGKAIEPRQSFPEQLSASRSFKLSEPDALGFRVATSDAAQLEKILGSPLSDARFHRIKLEARLINAGKPSANIVTFGRIALVYRDRTVVPQLISTPVKGFRGCELKEQCP